MRVFRFVSLFLSFSCGIFAQQLNHCGTQQALEWLYQNDPSAKMRVQTLLEAADDKNQGSQQRTSNLTSYTVPVVFHIVHLSGSENISDAQVLDAMRILNEDFAKENADTNNIVVPFKSIAANTNISFALATKDPDGKCTNGITRHYDAVTNWGAPAQSNYKFQWPANQYLNIYVVKSLSPGVAGYSFYPGNVPLSMDGIAILHNYVGAIGTGFSFGSRSLTHEVGHWLNLAHIWGSNNNPGQGCGDDGVSDTPITKGHGNCDLNSMVCNPGTIENVQNYMEYAFCSNMFTLGQATRMQTAINSSNGGRNNISTTANLIATGVINPSSNCAPKAEFVFTKTITCMNSPTSFIDASYNGSISNWKWSSPSASQTSTLQNGQLTFINSGKADVQLKVSNTFGSDSILKGNIYVLANGINSATTGITESFETTPFPNNKWFATLPQYGSGYAQFNTAGATGTKCVYVNNFQDSPSEPVNLFTPAYTITNTLNLQLQFKHAYAKSNVASNDRLKVYYTIDCGQNWNIISNKAGNALATVTAPISNTAFVPQANDWFSNSLALNVSSGQEIYFRFEFLYDNVNGAGNNFYLDDINISNTVIGLNEETLQEKNISIYPNPANQFIKLQMNTISQKEYTVQLLDVSGRVISNQKIVSNKVNELNISQLNKGLYFVRIGDAKQQIVKKVIID